MSKQAKSINSQPIIEGSEEELRILLQHFMQDSDGIAITDLKGKMLFVNPAFAEMHCYLPMELQGRNLAILHTRKQLPQCLEARRRLKRDGTFLGEICHRRRDGTVFTGAMRNSLIRDDKENPVFMVITLRDITQKKLLEQRLRQSEDMFSKMANVTSAAILIYQGDRFIYANPTAERISGYTQEELFSMNFWDMVHLDYRNMVKHRGRARQRGELPPKRYECMIITKQGENRWMDFAADTINYNGRPAGIITAVDRTDRKMAEERLVRSEEHYRCLTDNSLDGIALSRGQKFVYVNDSFCRIFGYGQSELIGKDMLQVVDPDDRKMVQERALKRASGEKIPQRYTFRGLTKSGKTVYLEVAACKLQINEDEPAILGIFRDVTEQRRLENELIEYKNRLEKMVDRRTARLRVVNQQLRNEKSECKKTAEALTSKHAALKEVLDHIGEDKRALQTTIMNNMDNLAFPLLHQLRAILAQSDGDSAIKYLDTLESNLKGITSAFPRKLSDYVQKLTPREIEICGMIRSGLNSKEIARLLSISAKTVDIHRGDIRRKLGLKGKSVNLVSFLQA